MSKTRRRVIENAWGIEGVSATPEGKILVMPWKVAHYSLMRAGILDPDAEPRAGESMGDLIARCGFLPLSSPDWPIINGRCVAPNIDGSFPPMPTPPVHPKPATVKPQPRLPSGKEGQMQAALADTLEQDGWYVRREVRTPNGHIDIVAVKPDVTLVVEVKRGSPTECAKAIGQVLMYCATLEGRVRPVIAVPTAAVNHKDLQSLCKRFEVELWPLDWIP